MRVVYDAVNVLEPAALGEERAGGYGSAACHGGLVPGWRLGLRKQLPGSPRAWAERRWRESIACWAGLPVSTGRRAPGGGKFCGCSRTFPNQW